jgi:hypothetical protein
MTGSGYPEDLRQDTSFFGRSAELYQLVRNLQRGRHTLILGEKGVGKSRLMMEARWVLTGHIRRIDFSPVVLARLRGDLAARIDPARYNVLFIEHATPLGDCLKECTEQLFYLGDLRTETGEERADWAAVKKRLAGAGSVKMQSIVFEAIARSEKPYIVLFDTLDRIAPGQHSFFESLMNIALVCAAAVEMKENVVFRRVWASFSKLTLEPLPEEVCIQLIDHFLDHYPIHIVDPELYRREILKASNGIPFYIKNLLWHGLREKYVDTEEIRRLRQSDAGHYFNMGPIYIFGVALFTMFRIFSIGSDNREFYIYFSALGFIAYIVFRVFRAFFLFRPQKYQ